MPIGRSDTRRRSCVAADARETGARNVDRSGPDRAPDHCLPAIDESSLRAGGRSLRAGAASATQAPDTARTLPLQAGDRATALRLRQRAIRSEEHTSELQSLMRISYAVLCLKKKKNQIHTISTLKENTRTYTYNIRTINNNDITQKQTLM